MKKILSFVLVLVLLFGVCVTVGAADESAALEQKFYNYCLEVLPEDMKPSTNDTVEIQLTKKVDEVEFFLGRCKWLEINYTNVVATFGEDVIIGKITYAPYDLGIYMSSGDEIYTLEEAYDAGYITDVSLLKPEFSGWFEFARKHISNPENEYEDAIFEILNLYDYPSDIYWEPFTYYESYRYFSPDNTETGDEATPDYVLIYLSGTIYTNIPIEYIFGDYVMMQSHGKTPFLFGYGIYVPQKQEVYDLVEAYNLGIEGIEKVFTDCGLGHLHGDMDGDRSLTVKDATEIQKCLANIDGKTIASVQDFNRDGERNVKDATAIQKYIAGLEY